MLFAVATLVGCDSGHSTPVAGIIAPGTTVTPSPVAGLTSSPTVTPMPTATATATASPTPTAPATTSSSCSTPTMASIGTAGGSITASAAMGTLTETLAPGALAATQTVTYCYVPMSGLPAALLRAPHRDRKSGQRTPMFTAGAGNTYVSAFTTTFGGSTLATAASETATGAVASTLPAGTQLNIAMYNGSTWVDIGTASVTTTGNYASSAPTVSLPGVTAAGTYLVYVPAAGTNTAQINLGFALVADDGSASMTDGLQFVQLEDNNGNALPTPTSTFFPIDGSDLDGQSLTPDAQQGTAIDGGNNVYFFSGIPQHTFKLAANPISVSNYGGDGDSIVSLPNGDEAVVTGDNQASFAVISGILSGSPVIADTVTPGMDQGSIGYRDGLVISTDGKTMLARGRDGLDVYGVAQVASHAGSTNMGTTSYNFTLRTTLETHSPGAVIPEAPMEDGRDDMAMSPTDDSRAVVVGTDGNTGMPSIVLLTGLNTNTPTVNTLRPQFAARPHRLGQVTRHREASPHRKPLALTPSAGTTLYAVSITPDGTTAFVSTDAGIIVVSGVNTGTLAQVGTVYSPMITTPTGMCQLASATTIGVLPDGKYLIADVDCSLTAGTTDSTQGAGVMVTIPILPGAMLGAPVGQLNNVVSPFNDQILIH